MSQSLLKSQKVEILGECAGCKEDIKKAARKSTDEDAVTCQKCSNQFHAKCVTKKCITNYASFSREEAVALLKALEITKGLSWTCDDCSDRLIEAESDDDEAYADANSDAALPPNVGTAFSAILSKIEEMQNAMKKLEENMGSMKSELGNRKINAKEVAEAVDQQLKSQSQTFAEILRAPAPLPRPRKSIVIPPKDKTTGSCDETIRRVSKCVEPVQQQIEDVQELNRCGIQITTDPASNDSILQTLTEQLTDSFDINEAGGRNPRIT